MGHFSVEITGHPGSLLSGNQQVDRLRKDADRLQERLDRLYIDHVDGRITAEMYDRMASTWREERERHLQHLERLHDADDVYIDDGIALLELGRNAHKTFSIQSQSAKNAVLNLLVSNSVWAGGSLKVEFNEPFGMLEQIQGPATGEEPQKWAENPQYPNWLPL